MKKIQVILADDHPTVLSGVGCEIARIPTMEVVGTAASSDDLLDLLSKTSCEVVITDFAMPASKSMDGLPLLRKLSRIRPDVKIIVLTTVDSEVILREIINAGVHSVLSKLDDVSHLVVAVHAVCAGEQYYSPTVRRPQSTDSQISSKQKRRLTPREIEVLRLYVRGLSIGEISAQLHRTKQTVSAQKIAAMKKLGIERDIDLYRYAHETGLLTSTVMPSHTASS